MIIKIKKNRSQVKKLLRTLPQIISGRAADPTGLSKALALRVATVALSFVKQSYIEKSRGLVDESGLQWEPLKQSTINQRRVGRRNQGQVMIGRDTGILLNTLSPGVPGNILTARPGLATIGTKCPYAQYFHAIRPIWPDPDQWPDRWLSEMSAEMINGAVLIARQLLR